MLSPCARARNGHCAAEQRDKLAAAAHVWMAPAWQEVTSRTAQKSLAVMCPACSRSPDGLLALMDLGEQTLNTKGAGAGAPIEPNANLVLPGRFEVGDPSFFFVHMRYPSLWQHCMADQRYAGTELFGHVSNCASPPTVLSQVGQPAFGGQSVAHCLVCTVVSTFPNRSSIKCGQSRCSQSPMQLGPRFGFK
jgi:hypothetical protein